MAVDAPPSAAPAIRCRARTPFQHSVALTVKQQQQQQQADGRLPPIEEDLRQGQDGDETGDCAVTVQCTSAELECLVNWALDRMAAQVAVKQTSKGALSFPSF